MYFIGSKEILQERFPELDWEHRRVSIDGSEAVVEYDCDADADIVAELEAEGILALTHDDALEYLNHPDMEGVWFTSPVAESATPLDESSRRPSPTPEPNTQGGDE
ncbi:MAG: hypothetical protein AB1728_13255 [Bacteroidota bacterium]